MGKSWRTPFTSYEAEARCAKSFISASSLRSPFLGQQLTKLQEPRAKAQSTVGPRSDRSLHGQKLLVASIPLQPSECRAPANKKAAPDPTTRLWRHDRRRHHLRRSRVRASHSSAPAATAE